MIGISITVVITDVGTSGSGGSANILNEDGSVILTESGDKIIQE